MKKFEKQSGDWAKAYTNGLDAAFDKRLSRTVQFLT
jgi:hypothetical protein